MRIELAFPLLAACGVPTAPGLPSEHAPPTAREPLDRSGPCGMLDAIYATNDASFRRALTHPDLHAPLTFEVVARASVFPPDTRCAGRPYRIFHGDRELRGAIVVLELGPSGSVVSVGARLEDPNGRPAPGGGFDDTNYYQYYDGLVVERVDDHWRTVRPPQ